MKHKMWSRLLSMALAVMMIVSIVPNSAFAEAANEITSTSQVQEIPAEETQTPEEVTVPEAETPAEPSTEPAPTEEPVAEPTAEPTVEPTAEPTQAPAETVAPSEQPSQTPEATVVPSAESDSETTSESDSEVTSEAEEAEEEVLVSEDQAAQWMDLEDGAFREVMAALTEEEKAFIAQQEGETYIALAQRMEKLATQEEEPVATEEPAQPMTFEQTVDQVTVKAVAAPGALPEGTTMQVAMLGQDEEAAAVLEENEVQHDGYLALDISFFDAEDNEIEPEEGSVQVNFELAAELLSENANPETLAVQHLAEDKETGEVTVETVADAAEETAGTIEVKPEEALVTAEFEVQSFSKFVITWDDTEGDYGWEDQSVTVYYVDTNGRELTASNVQNVDKDQDDVVTLSDYDVGIAGYEYRGAHLSSYNGQSVSQLCVDERTEHIFGGRYYTYYQLQYKDGNSSWKDTDATSVYLVYEKKADPSIPDITQSLTHDKYVEDNKDGTYDLNLTVSGAIGSVDNKAKVDVIFVLDKSTSMRRYINSNGGTDNWGNYGWGASFETSRMKKAVEAIKTMTDALSAEETVDAQYALVTFGTRSSSSGQWMNASQLKNFLPNHVDTNEGTNYEAGLLDAKDLLTGFGVRSDATKVVVFVSDGDPTYYYNTNYGVEGNASSYDEEAMRQAMYAVADLDEADYFFTVGVGPKRNYSRLNYLTDFDASGAPWVAWGTELPEGMKTDNYSGTDEISLKSAFEDIKGQITQLLCTDVKITDIFSNYAQPVMNGDSPKSLTLTIKQGDQTLYGPSASVSIPETKTNQRTTLTPAYQNGQLTLDFPADYQLEAGWNYIITIEIEPTEEAYSLYQENNGYIHTGDLGTGVTSANQPGVYSNAVGTKVDYTFNEKQFSEDYAFPVIQIDPTKISEYPVRFYLEGVNNNAGATNYDFKDDWAKLDAVYRDGYVALPDANTCVDSEDLVVDNGVHQASDTITGDTGVRAWLNTNDANPVGLSVDSIKDALQALVDANRLSKNATLVSVGGTTYTVQDVLDKPDDFELVYTQVAENEDYIQEYYRGNRNGNYQKSYHVHLTVKYKPGDMTITKTFSGVDALPENYQVKVKLGDQVIKTLTLADATNTGNTYNWTLNDLNGADYTVLEENADVDGQNLKATFTVQKENGSPLTTEGTSATVPVEMRKTTTVNIRNEYTPANGNLVITKTLKNMNKSMGDDATFQFKITNTDTGMVWYRYLTFTQADTQRIELKDIPAGKYTVEEMSSLGYTLEADCEAVQEVSVTHDEDGKAAFTNVSTGGNTPGDQDIVRNNFRYDSQKNQWVFEQK